MPRTRRRVAETTTMPTAPSSTPARPRGPAGPLAPLARTNKAPRSRSAHLLRPVFRPELHGRADDADSALRRRELERRAALADADDLAVGPAQAQRPQRLVDHLA